MRLKHLKVDMLETQSVAVSDEEGRRRIIIHASNNEPTIGLYDKNENLRASFSLDALDNPSITLRKDDEKALIAIFLTEDNEPLIKIYDRDEQTRLAVYMMENRPAINFYDNHEKLRMSLYLSENGDASLKMYDATEKVINTVEPSPT